MSVSDGDFQFVRRLVEEHSAIALADGKAYLVEARLAPLVRREGLESIGELISRLRLGAPALRDDVVDAITTNETSFFRDAHPFAALRDEIIPSLLAGGDRPLSIWSAAASTGQEAYSVAMLMSEHFPHASPPAILATDLSRDVLARGKAGLYSQLEVNRGLPIRQLMHHFDRRGLDWQVKEALRRTVTFRQLNLARPWTALPPFDIVLLRNVLIYFDIPAKKAVLQQMSRVLRPGGYLFLGSTETTHGMDSRFERRQIGQTVCYRLGTTDGGNR